MERYTLHYDKQFYDFLDNNNMEVAGWGEWRQFRNCQAWTTDILLYNKETDEYIPAYVLQSYYTLVAIFFEKTETCIRLGKWSTTTSKQTSQWENAIRYRSWRWCCD